VAQVISYTVTAKIETRRDVVLNKFLTYLWLFSKGSLKWSYTLFEPNPSILPVVLYECKNWSLTPRKDHKLRVSENNMAKRISRPKKLSRHAACIENEKYISKFWSQNLKEKDY
jgi:hypothetical protein